jgi:hypothetical protein
MMRFNLCDLRAPSAALSGCFVPSAEIDEPTCALPHESVVRPKLSARRPAPVEGFPELA